MKMHNHTPETILIVDDSAETIAMISELFQEAYTVKVATCGKDALTLLQSGSLPDLILLDIVLPDIDGLTLAKRLRKDSRFGELPIIFLTSRSDPESIYEAFTAGARDYVKKPYNAIELRERVKTHLELKRQRQKLANINAILEQMVADRTRELHEANNKLQWLDTAKSRFLSLISHEMNIPVAVMLGYLEVMEEELAASQYSDYVREVKNAVERLRFFIKKALLITSLQTGRYSLEKKHIVRVLQFLEAAISEHEAAISEKKLNIDVDCDQSLAIAVDEPLVQSCISGIMHNAIRYSPDNGSIAIAAVQTGGGVNISMRDEGPGFPQVVLDRSFDLFILGEDPIKMNYGLHLAMSKLIVEAHDGSISLVNRESGGAEVTVMFPAVS